MDLAGALIQVREAAAKFGHVTEAEIARLVISLEFDEVDALLEMLTQSNITVVADENPIDTSDWKYPNPMAILRSNLTVDQVQHLRQRLLNLGFSPPQVALYCAVRMKHHHRTAFEIISRTSRELALKVYEAEGPLGEIWRRNMPEVSNKKKRK